MSSAVLFQIQSALIVALLTFGLVKRRQRSLHVKLMGSAIVWDILLILQIELTRGAIAKASKVVKNPGILNIHVGLALTTVLLYCFMLYSGRRILKGSNDKRHQHKVAGITCYTLRILTFITSFFAV